jgi:hypothetical protein
VSSEPLRLPSRDRKGADWIARRIAKLDDLERMIADARQRDRAGKLDDDLTLRELARQGPSLLERVMTARQAYAELRQAADRERQQRTPSPLTGHEKQGGT